MPYLLFLVCDWIVLLIVLWPLDFDHTIDKRKIRDIIAHHYLT